jgi:TonB family protein
MAKKKDISANERNTLTAEDLKRYEAGEMTFQEMHRVEKILLEQPFYADASEGFAALKKDKVFTDKNVGELKARLKNRTNTNSDKQTPVLTLHRIWKPVSIAAALLIVFVGTYYLIDNKQKETDTAVMLKSTTSAGDLSAPAASEPIAKKDNTGLNKSESLPALTEKRNRGYENHKQAHIPGNKPEDLPVMEETIADVISIPVETDKIATEVPPAAGVAPAPMVIEKKTVADREETSAESRTLAGAARMARATISGKVVDEENQPMKDVTVNIKGKPDGIKTDEEGKFSLRDARKGDIIILNSLTMPQMEVPLKTLPGKIVYSNDNIKPPGKQKVTASNPTDAMLGKAVTDARPEFGWEAYDVYLKENTKRPPKAEQSNIQGRVIVSFVVDEKGGLSDFSIIRSLGFGCDEEAIRIIKNGPRWFPATKEDKPVRSSAEVVVRFK